MSLEFFCQDHKAVLISIDVQVWIKCLLISARASIFVSFSHPLQEAWFIWKNWSSGRSQAPEEEMWGTVKLLQALGDLEKASICLIQISVDLVLVNVPLSSWCASVSVRFEFCQGHRSDSCFICVQWAPKEGQTTLWLCQTKKCLVFLNLWTIDFPPQVKPFPGRLPYSCLFPFKIIDGVSYGKHFHPILQILKHWSPPSQYVNWTCSTFLSQIISTLWGLLYKFEISPCLTGFLLAIIYCYCLTSSSAQSICWDTGGAVSYLSMDLFMPFCFPAGGS